MENQEKLETTKPIPSRQYRINCKICNRKIKNTESGISDHAKFSRIHKETLAFWKAGSRNILTISNILKIISKYLTVEELLILRNTRNKKIFLCIQEYYLKRKHELVTSVVRELETLFVSNFEVYVKLTRQHDILDYVEIETPLRVLEQIILDIDEGFRIQIFKDKLVMLLDERIDPNTHKYFTKNLVNPMKNCFFKQNPQRLEHYKVFNLDSWINLKIKLKVSKTNENFHKIELFGQKFPLRNHYIGVDPNFGVWNRNLSRGFNYYVPVLAISTFGNLGPKNQHLNQKSTLNKMKNFGLKLNFLFANDFGSDFEESLYFVTKKPIGIQFNSMLNYAMNSDKFSSFQNCNKKHPVAPNHIQMMTKNLPMRPNLVPMMPQNSNSMHGQRFPFNQYQNYAATPNFQSNPAMLNFDPPMKPNLIRMIPPNFNSMYGPQFLLNKYQISMATLNFQRNQTMQFTQNSNANNIYQRNLYIAGFIANYFQQNPEQISTFQLSQNTNEQSIPKDKKVLDPMSNSDHPAQKFNISDFPVAPPGFDHKVEHAFKKSFQNFNPSSKFFEEYKNK